MSACDHSGKVIPPELVDSGLTASLFRCGKCGECHVVEKDISAAQETTAEQAWAEYCKNILPRKSGLRTNPSVKMSCEEFFLNYVTSNARGFTMRMSNMEEARFIALAAAAYDEYLQSQAPHTESEPVAFMERITGRVCLPDDAHREKFPMCYDALYLLSKAEGGK